MRKQRLKLKKIKQDLAMKKDVTELFCWIDDFCIFINKENRKIQESRRPTRVPALADSEIMTIMLMFQQSPCKNFKYFYNSYLQLYKPEFPKMPTYERFVALIPRVLYLLVILLFCVFRRGSKVAYIDSTSLNVYHPKRITRNKVFKGLAEIGKSSKG